MRRYLAVLAFSIGAVTFPFVSSTLAQSPGAGPAFEVVSIKPNNSVIGPGYRANVVTWRPDGGLTITNVTIGSLIARAYPGMVPADIVGLPVWDRTEHFDVSATSSLARATPDDRAAMLRGMLADRFKLSVHVEKRQQQVYDLVLARADRRLGPGLEPLGVDCARVIEERIAAAELAPVGGTPPPPQQPADFRAPPPPCTLRTFPIWMRDRSADPSAGNVLEGEGTMNSLAGSLRLELSRRAVDKTGLSGSYRVRMTYDPKSGRGGPPLDDQAGSAPSIFTAMQEQLGLKLVASQAVVDTLVIDRIERPTDN